MADQEENLLLRNPTKVHVTALDGLVSVNSLFTIAVFIGLSITTTGQISLENRTGCDAGIAVYKWLYVFEVLSFSFFLFSSLVAQGLKLVINMHNSRDLEEASWGKINKYVLKCGMIVSAAGSVVGCAFLVLSMVNVIQIRLGMLSCWIISAVLAVAVLGISVVLALGFYIVTVIKAFSLPVVPIPIVNGECG